MDHQEAFPLMKLPTEIRLMVYERIPVHIKKHVFTQSNKTPSGSTSSYSFAIVSKSIDPSILSTCRQVHAEASAIMQKQINNILQTPPRMIVDVQSSTKLYKSGGPLWHISHHLAKSAVKAGKSLGSVPYVGIGVGASVEKYDPTGDAHYPQLARLMDHWFRSLDYQRRVKGGGLDGYPSIEIALTAPREWPHSSIVYSLRQLAYVLFTENGDFRFKIRSAGQLYPPSTTEMREQEKHVIDKVMVGRSHNVVRAVQGHRIEHREFEDDWNEGSYLCIAT